MKEPKTFKYPRVYFQEGDDKYIKRLAYSNRVRVIYPDGTCEWLCDQNVREDGKFYRPCWGGIGVVSSEGAHGVTGKLRSGPEAVERMKLYDSIEGFLPADFVCEIK